MSERRRWASSTQITVTLRRFLSPVSCPSQHACCSSPFRSLAAPSLVRLRMNEWIISILTSIKSLISNHFSTVHSLFLGKEHFPAEFPEELQQLFHSLLLSGVLATVQSFDGSVNVLSLSQPPETGGGDVTATLLEALQAQAKSPPSPTLKADHTDKSTSPANSTAAPECPLLTPKPEAQKATENTPATPSLTMTPKSSPQTPQQNKNTPAVSVNGWSNHNFDFCII